MLLKQEKAGLIGSRFEEGGGGVWFWTLHVEPPALLDVKHGLGIRTDGLDQLQDPEHVSVVPSPRPPPLLCDQVPNLQLADEQLVDQAGQKLRDEVVVPAPEVVHVHQIPLHLHAVGGVEALQPPDQLEECGRAHFEQQPRVIHHLANLGLDDQSHCFRAFASGLLSCHKGKIIDLHEPSYA